MAQLDSDIPNLGNSTRQDTGLAEDWPGRCVSGVRKVYLSREIFCSGAKVTSFYKNWDWE